MIRYNGGIDWIILKLTSRIHSSKGAEMSIAALVSFANLCTANNTIALIMAGPIAKILQIVSKSTHAAAQVFWIFSLVSFRESSPTGHSC